MGRAASLILVLASAICAQADGWSAFAAKPTPDIAFPDVVLNDTGQGLLSHFRGRSVVVVLIALDSHIDHWVEAERVLRRASYLSDRGLDIVLWLNDASPRDDRDARVFARAPWFTGLVVAGPITFTSAPQYWLMLADGTLHGRRMNQRGTQGKGTLDRFLTPGITSAKGVRAGWGETRTQKQVRALAYGHGHLARARTLLMRRPDSEERRLLLDELEDLFARRLRQTRHDVEDGRLHRAQASAAQLIDDVKGWEQREDAAYESLRPLRAPGAKAQLKFERHLERWLQAVRAGRPTERHADQLQSLMTRCPEGVVRERARRLLDLVQRATKIGGNR